MRNTNQIYFSIDVDNIMFAPYEFSVRYGLKEYTPARLQFESVENAESTLNVYPNPAQSFINVALPTTITQGTIQIFDLQGKLMLTKSIDDTFQNEINIDNLHAGTYIIKLISNEMVITDKFVKL
ncbi:MAG: T9SS type A sorting domain-containing protein [Bacteroidetes bacterium]|nr:T9SS type A sorting domain-containing protein [Bacteroidota bacterium]